MMIRRLPEADEQLMRSIAAGDAAAMEAIVKTKLPRIMSLARRMLGDAAEAEDVTQEAFVKIWNNAARWENRGASFDTWIHRVTMNLCYDRLRLRARRPVQGLVIDVASDEPNAEEALVAGGPEANHVEAALQRLADRQREAIVLVYYQRLSNIEAAQVMEASVEALESLLSRARRNLRRILMEEAR